MASSMNRIGNNPFFRNTVGVPNNQGTTERQALQRMLRETPFTPKQERDWMRDLMKQPIRPSQDRRLPSPVPKIPPKTYRELENKAFKIASRIAKATIPIFRFRQIVKWLLDMLMDWFINRLLKRANTGAWRQVASCSAPLPSIGPEVYSSSAGYLPTNQSTNCITGQGGGGTYPSVGAIPSTHKSYYQMNHYADALGVPRYQNIGCFYRDVPALPSIWMDIDLNVDKPRVNEWTPPKAIRPSIKPDWKAIVDETIPDTAAPPEENNDSATDERQETRRISINNKLQTQFQRLKTTRKPTRTREKEKKFAGTSDAVRALFGFLARNKERLTELDDLLDIFIDAMPKDIQDKMPKRNGRGTPDLKMKHIYDNFDSIDWNKFADEWVKNWIEDKVVGTAIAGSDKAAKTRGESNTIGSRNWLHSSTKGKMPWFN